MLFAQSETFLLQTAVMAHHDPMQKKVQIKTQIHSVERAMKKHIKGGRQLKDWLQSVALY